MDKFWDLLASSAVVQGILTVMVVGADIYLFATRQPIPEQLWQLTMLVVAFYFGAKSQSYLSTVQSRRAGK